MSPRFLRSALLPACRSTALAFFFVLLGHLNAEDVRAEDLATVDANVDAKVVLVHFTDKSFEVTLYDKGGGSAAPALSLLVRTKSAEVPKAFILSDPLRVVLDIPHLSSRQTFTLAARDNPLVKSLRIGTSADKLRLVLDIKQGTAPPAYLHYLGDEIFINLGAYQAKADDVPIAPQSQAQDQVASQVMPQLDLTRQQVLAASTTSPTVAASPLPKQQLIPATGLAPAAQATIVPVPPAPSADVLLPLDLPPPSQLLQFSVDKVFITFEAIVRPVENITVYNKTLAPIYIALQVEKVLNPGTKDERRLPTQDLVASPRRFELKPDEPRVFRILLSRRPESVEDVYRISLVPQLESFEQTVVDAEVSGRPTKLRVVTGLSIAVDALPPDAKHTIESSVKGNSVTLRNTGNASFVLESGRFCPIPGGACSSIPSKRLYAGGEWIINLPAPGSLEFLKRTGFEFEPLILSTESLKK